MAEYVNRDEVIQAVETYFIDVLELNPDICIDGIRSLPAADVVEKQQGEWIPVTSRPMDEEERAEWSAKIGYAIEDEDAIIFTSQMPDDGEEVLTCNRYGYVRIDTFNNDPEYGCYFEDNGDMDGIVAWMPKPKPYKPPKEQRPSHQNQCPDIQGGIWFHASRLSNLLFHRTERFIFKNNQLASPIQGAKT
ncbi:MAG: hypothetical protein J6N19_13580 [Clostridium sp.]|nr:hypothetical protein [Clostridium sp.]